MPIKFEQFQKALDISFDQIFDEWIELIDRDLEIEMKNKENTFTKEIVLRFYDLSKGYLKDAIHHTKFRQKIQETYVSNGWKDVFFDAVWDSTIQQMTYKIIFIMKPQAPIV